MDRTRCYGYERSRNAENGVTVEKKQLLEDLYYKRNKRTINFIYFNLEAICEGHLKEISLIKLTHIIFAIIKIRKT